MKEKSTLVLVGALKVILIILITVIAATWRHINKEKKAEYEGYLKDIVETASRIVDEHFDMLEETKNEFIKCDNSTKEKMVLNLCEQERKLNKDYISVLLISKENECYSKDSKAYINGMAVKGDSIIVYRKDEMDYFAFVSQMSNSILCEDTEFVNLAYSIPFEILRPYFKSEHVKSEYIAVIEDNGKVVFDLNGGVGINLYDELRKKSNDYDQISKIVKNIKEDINGCDIIKINRKNMYITYQRLNNWGFISISSFKSAVPKGHDYYLMVSVSVLTISVVAGLLGFFLSTTIKKRLDDKKSVKLLKEQNQDLTNAVDIANAANDAKSDFLSRISHDIRTPMNGIVGMTYIAKQNINNKDKVYDCLNKIEQASDHLLSLLNNVLELSRIEQSIVNLNYTPTNLFELLKSCEAMLISQSKKYSLQLKSNFNLIHEYFMIDDLRLKQVIINILSNAVKFSKYGGKIWFNVEENIINKTESKIKILIKDTGIGMSDEFLVHIFEPFVQENKHDARTSYTGSGLGMSIVKELVNLMGGDINIHSEVDEGTAVVLELQVEYLKNEEELNEKLGEYDKLEGMRVLLVEDNAVNIEIAEALLNEVKIKVDKALNGKEAVEIFNNSPLHYYDAILMDVLMPVMDGYEATKEIQSLNRLDNNTPIIAMTANAYAEDRDKALAAGMCAHVTKPIQIEKLYDILLGFVKK